MTAKKISGIHNYCDRWCERCAFGSRCAVYEDENKNIVSSQEKDMSNKAFWDRLAVNFAKARTLLEQTAAQQGIDLNALSKEIDDVEKKKQRIKIDSKEHPLAKLSLQYGETSGKWLKSQPGMMKMLEQLRDGLTMGIESVAEAKTTTETVKDCLEVIQWYMTFIHVKLMRALMGKMDYEEENGFQCDFDGSAKIAYIAIERSAQAWIKLYDLLPDHEDEFLTILSMLEKLKGMITTEFPNALKFKRPGFDD